MSFQDKDLLEMYQKIEKESKMADRVANIARGNAGQTLVGNYFVNEVKKMGDDVVLLKVGNKDSIFTKTNDSRKPDEHGAKYSNPTIFYYKRKTVEVPTDFLRKGDYVRVYSKFIEGTEDVEVDLKGLDATQLQELLKDTYGANVRDGKLVIKRIKNHYFGYDIEPINLTKETQDAIKEYRQTAKENKQREMEIKDYFVKRSESGIDTSANTNSTPELSKPNVEDKPEVKPQTETVKESQPEPSVTNSKPVETETKTETQSQPPTDTPAPTPEQNVNNAKETVLFGEGMSFSWD